MIHLLPAKDRQLSFSHFPPLNPPPTSSRHTHTLFASFPLLIYSPIFSRSRYLLRSFRAATVEIATPP